MSAPVTTIGGAGLDAMVLRDPLADFAVNPVWIQIGSKPFETRRIVWKIAVKIFNRVLSHFSLLCYFSTSRVA